MSKGKCYSCGNIYSGRGLTRHIKSCKDLQNKLQSEQGEDIYFMLRIRGKYNKSFFLYLDIKGEAIFDELDQFLRDIWLECCNHLSDIRINDKVITFPSESYQYQEFKLIDLLDLGSFFTYRYDFGSTTELEIDVLDKRKGAKRKDTIEILARNLLTLKCEECGKRAIWITWDDDHFPYYFCDDCIEEYNGEYGYLPIVNSPRMGVCGYDGPADKYKDITSWNGF